VIDPCFQTKDFEKYSYHEQKALSVTPIIMKFQIDSQNRNRLQDCGPLSTSSYKYSRSCLVCRTLPCCVPSCCCMPSGISHQGWGCTFIPTPCPFFSSFDLVPASPCRRMCSAREPQANSWHIHCWMLYNCPVGQVQWFYLVVSHGLNHKWWFSIFTMLIEEKVCIYRVLKICILSEAEHLPCRLREVHCVYIFNDVFIM
jgi:hypothetical protein